MLARPVFLPSSHTTFAAELHAAVCAYLEARSDHRYGNATTAFKVLILTIATVALFIASLHATRGIVFILLYCTFYVAAVLLSANTTHDASHGALFRSRALNALTMRIITIPLGIEPVYWGTRHVRYHHDNANIEHVDLDTEANAFLRQSPFQPWHWQFRFQPFYYPLVAGFSLSWIGWVYDWSDRLGHTPLADDNLLPGLPGWTTFILSKLAHFGLFLGVPLLVAGPSAGYGAVIGGYVAGQMLASSLLLMLLLASHWADTQFFDVSDGMPLPHTREEHIFLTSCDWEPTPQILGVLFGGLHLHLTHHLFPGYSNRHYHALHKIVAQIAARHGLPYRCLSHRELITARQRFLKLMGRQAATPQ
jgi:linoleoyl-CoA desaturase